MSEMSNQNFENNSVNGTRTSEGKFFAQQVFLGTAVRTPSSSSDC